MDSTNQKDLNKKSAKQAINPPPKVKENTCIIHSSCSPLCATAHLTYAPAIQKRYKGPCKLYAKAIQINFQLPFRKRSTQDSFGDFNHSPVLKHPKDLVFLSDIKHLEHWGDSHSLAATPPDAPMLSVLYYCEEEAEG